MTERIYSLTMVSDDPLGIGVNGGEEIVRCRDCRHYSEHEWIVATDVDDVCHFWHGKPTKVSPDGFCAWGERNDDSTPKNDVSDAEVDVTTDSREKLEADAFNLIAQMVNEAYSMGEREATWTVNRASVHERIASWFNRQAAITEEEARCKWVVATADEIARLRVENMNLARDLGECMADRDELREKLSTAIAHARCIARLIELG